MFKKIQVRVTGEIRWKDVWPNNTSIQKPWPRVETVALLKAERVALMSSNRTVEEIYNTFHGEFGFISEEVPPWKVGFSSTAVQEQSAEVDSRHKILCTHCLYSLGVVRL